MNVTYAANRERWLRDERLPHRHALVEALDREWQRRAEAPHPLRAQLRAALTAPRPPPQASQLARQAQQHPDPDLQLLGRELARRLHRVPLESSLATLERQMHEAQQWPCPSTYHARLRRHHERLTRQLQQAEADRRRLPELLQG